MVDRAPTKPNRYAVYDENHNFIRYEYHERADEPTQEGDALNKANLLPDDVASALGLTGNPQVKDALDKLKTLADIGISRAQIATGSYTGTGTCGASNPVNLVFPFVPKVVFMSGVYTDGSISSPTTGGSVSELSSFVMDCGSLNNNYSQFCQMSRNVKLLVKKSSDEKTISFYSDTAKKQCNDPSFSYYYTAIG